MVLVVDISILPASWTDNLTVLEVAGAVESKDHPTECWDRGRANHASLNCLGRAENATQTLEWDKDPIPLS
jgi:hypothetical protein